MQLVGSRMDVRRGTAPRTRKDLVERLALARELGWAVSNAEIAPNVAGISSAVIDAESRKIYGIGIGIAIALAYWILLHVFLAIGAAGLLPPFLAGWSANIIVAGAAAFLFLNTRT